MEVITKNARETQEFGKTIASNLTEGGVWALVGELGSGKTTFVQGFARGLGIEKRVISPTFILMREYKISSTDLLRSFFHIDLYRLEDDIVSELKNLGLEELMSVSHNVLVIEWADKARNIFPQNTHWVNFSIIDENTRKIILM